MISLASCCFDSYVQNLPKGLSSIASGGYLSHFSNLRTWNINLRISPDQALFFDVRGLNMYLGADKANHIMEVVPSVHLFTPAYAVHSAV